MKSVKKRDLRISLKRRLTDMCILPILTYSNVLRPGHAPIRISPALEFVKEQ